MVEGLFPPGCVVVVGLRSEAALLPAGTRIVVSGGDPLRLAALLPADARAVLSFGIAGGLSIGTGALIAASGIWEDGVLLPVDAAWTARLPGAPGLLAGSSRLLDTIGAKAALHAASGAVAVDMESGVAARFAQARGIPFAALRAVADGPEDTLPPAAAVGLNADGSPAIRRVLASLLRQPGQMPGLIRLARASARAHAVLRDALASPHAHR